MFASYGSRFELKWPHRSKKKQRCVLWILLLNRFHYRPNMAEFPILSKTLPELTPLFDAPHTHSLTNWSRKTLNSMHFRTKYVKSSKKRWSANWKEALRWNPRNIYSWSSVSPEYPEDERVPQTANAIGPFPCYSPSPGWSEEAQLSPNCASHFRQTGTLRRTLLRTINYGPRTCCSQQKW